MASKTSEAAVETSAAKPRKPTRIAATFVLKGPDGVIIDTPAGTRLVVQSVTRDLAAFAEHVLDNPAAVGLYAKIEVPFAEP